MIGTLSQLVALASAANGVLADRVDPSTFYPGHDEFKFCNAARFVDVKPGFLRKAREVVRHENPNEWLQSLRHNRVRRVWLTYSASDESTDAPDHQLAAFVGGGGDWTLVVGTDSETEHWLSRWEVTNQNAPDNRIWCVTYGCVGKSTHAFDPPNGDLEQAAARLAAVLADINEFALKHDLPMWADRFQHARSCLTSDIAFPEYVNFVCLDSYPETAQRVFATAYAGWVFGGMGSWNDLYFEPNSENTRYNDLSSELYAAINDGIQQATRSFREPQAG